MSGLLRRIKRSRPADAGEPLPEGQAAAPEGAGPATEPATGATEPVAVDAPAQPEAPKEKPVLLADPNTPAGVDPAAAPFRPPAGRRGRLRRRLRYLRRARELMLRDLGGLLYEIHRTGGGNVEAHGTIVSAKVERIAGLDAEAHALETALSAPRAEAIVFQPGVGGTCPACGALYGSDARFCANCGTAIGVAALPAPAPATDPTPTPAPATRESVFGRPSQPAQALSSGDPLTSPGADQPTVDITPGDVPPQEPAAAGTPQEGADETAVVEPETAPGAAAAPEPGADDQPAVAEVPQESGADDTAVAEPAPPADATPGDDATQVTDPEPTGGDAPATGPDGERNPFSGLRNGRAEDHTPPELSSGDPLVRKTSS